MNLFNRIGTFISKIKNPLSLIELEILKQVSSSLPIEHKIIFDYQVSKYNLVRRNKYSREVYFYYIKFGKVKKMDKEFKYSEVPKTLAEFNVVINNKIYNGKAIVVNGRFFSLYFDNWIDFYNHNDYQIHIKKIISIRL